MHWGMNLLDVLVSGACNSVCMTALIALIVHIW